MATFTAELELALACAALGDLAEGIASIERLLEAQREHDNPLLHGLSHKARAQLALEQRDAETFAQHLGEMEAWFRRTDSPTLIAQCQRLAEQAARVLSPRHPRASGTHVKASTLEPISVAFDACRGPAERLRVAIDLVLAETGAERGYLYLVESTGLRFAAPRVGTEPPVDLLTCVAAQLDELRRDPTHFVSGCTVEVQNSDRANTVSEYVLQLLAADDERDLLVVGAVAL